jgi:hypothetical protein
VGGRGQGWVGESRGVAQTQGAAGKGRAKHQGNKMYDRTRAKGTVTDCAGSRRKPQHRPAPAPLPPTHTPCSAPPVSHPVTPTPCHPHSPVALRVLQQPLELLHISHAGHGHPGVDRGAHVLEARRRDGADVAQPRELVLIVRELALAVVVECALRLDLWGWGRRDGCRCRRGIWAGG